MSPVAEILGGLSFSGPMKSAPMALPTSKGRRKKERRRKGIDCWDVRTWLCPCVKTILLVVDNLKITAVT